VIAAELVKQARRARTWATLGAIAAIPAALTLTIGATRPALTERVGDYDSVVTESSGLTLAPIALSAMLLFVLPLAAAVFAGECVAGEAAWGSLRYLLCRPLARWRVLGAKAAVAALCSLTAVGLVGVVALASGALAFGVHPLSVLDLQHTTPFVVASTRLAPAAALARIGLSLAYVTAMLSSTFAFALLLSTLTARPFSAVAGAVGFGLVSRALDNVPGLHAISPWLPLTDESSNLWTGFLTSPMQTHGIAHALLVQALYTVAFAAAAVWSFARADALA
jgi:ABC-2 type transport system permease protein